VAFGARDVPPQPFYATPSKRARYLGPVYLLTSDVTVSAGEIFTLLMRALPNVVHVGGTTRGALSDTTEVKLPNNWSLVLPMEVYVDREGQNYEVRGIPPQEKIDLFPPQNLAGAHARAVLALMEKIRRDMPTKNPEVTRIFAGPQEWTDARASALRQVANRRKRRGNTQCKSDFLPRYHSKMASTFEPGSQ
jgi:hypothetical protein